jgi:hypothetical protein
MCLNLEHYSAASHGIGWFVPREEAIARTEQIGKSEIRVSIEPFENWKLESRISLRLRPHWVVEAEYEFIFHDDYKCFLPLFSNYFVEPTEPFLRLGGKWVQPGLNDKEHRFWPKSADDAEAIKRAYLEGMDAARRKTRPIDPQVFDLPIMVTPVGNASYYVINIIEPRFCSNLSANRKYNAHDFSPIGKDCANGSSVSFKAWLVVREMQELDEALKVYSELVGD